MCGRAEARAGKIRSFNRVSANKYPFMAALNINYFAFCQYCVAKLPAHVTYTATLLQGSSGTIQVIRKMCLLQ